MGNKVKAGVESHTKNLVVTDKQVPINAREIGKYPFEVADRRNTAGRTPAIEIHIWHRPDIPYEVADREVRTALALVFGETPPKGTELLYRDEQSIRSHFNMERQVLGINSFYVEIPPPTCYAMNPEDIQIRLFNCLKNFV